MKNDRSRGRVGSEAGAWATAPLPRGRVRDPTPGPRPTGTSPDYRGEVVLSEVGVYPALFGKK